MDFTILTNAGIDVDSAIGRFVGNKDLYARMLRKFLEEQSYNNLVNAIAENNESDALAASHTLKGLCGNLSLTHLFELFSEQVTLMRASEWDKAVGMMPEISKSYEEITTAIKNWLETL
ncbi:MAG: Hpt domain-containing protein [Oscillospiraceae bacterium]